MGTGRFVIMGVAGCGKTSVGEALASRLGWHFEDGDALHPQSSIDKMSAGIPLDDDDRLPWLRLVGERLRDTPPPVAIGCSALKRIYRDTIRMACGGGVCFIHLAGPRAMIEQRMAARRGHFMPVTLLDSQFAALEPPGPDETALTIDISGTRAAIVDAIIAALEEQPA